MTCVAQAAAEIAAVEEQIRRVPSSALRQGDALIEWLDEIRSQLTATRKGLLADATATAISARGRLETGQIAVGGRIVHVVHRDLRRMSRPAR